MKTAKILFFSSRDAQIEPPDPEPFPEAGSDPGSHEFLLEAGARAGMWR